MVLFDAASRKRDVIGGNFRPAATSGTVVVGEQVDGYLRDAVGIDSRQVGRELLPQVERVVVPCAGVGNLESG